MSSVKRQSIDKKYQWDLSSIIKNEQIFEEIFADVTNSLNDFNQYNGKLGNKVILLDCLNKQSEISLKIRRLYVYSTMKKHENAKDSKYVALTSRAEGLLSRVESATSFITPEMSILDKKYLDDLVADKKFANYSRQIAMIIENKTHILSSAEEKLLAESGEIFNSFKSIFAMIDNADIEFKPVVDELGVERELTHGTYAVLLQNKNQAVRKEAFKNYYQSYKAVLNTITSVYSSEVKKDCVLSKTRKYNSCLEKALSEEEVAPIVYSNLIKGVSDNLKYVHEYVALRKTMAKLDELHMYDMYVSLIDSVNLSLEYPKAIELVKKGLMPLGEEYQNLIEKAYTENWIDVYENEGKRSGAYSWDAYVGHPYVLLNYQETSHDVFTIAHELGHAMHSFYSAKNNCYEKAEYPIFLAEIASTVNEVLLLKHIISITTDKQAKKYYLSYFLDMFRTTLFRQTMFSEFENIVHEKVEGDIPLTVESLNNDYYMLNKKYYGDAVIHDEEIAFEWARIPHFYTSYYVYKYATGITSAIVIANAILTEGESAVKRYKEFLSSGGNLPPLEILKKAGVDLTTTKPFEVAMECFKSTLQELQSLAD